MAIATLPHAIKYIYQRISASVARDLQLVEDAKRRGNLVKYNMCNTHVNNWSVGYKTLVLVLLKVKFPKNPNIS